MACIMICIISLSFRVGSGAGLPVPAPSPIRFMPPLGQHAQKPKPINMQRENNKSWQANVSVVDEASSADKSQQPNPNIRSCSKTWPVIHMLRRASSQIIVALFPSGKTLSPELTRPSQQGSKRAQCFLCPPVRSTPLCVDGNSTVQDGNLTVQVDNSFLIFEFLQRVLTHYGQDTTRITETPPPRKLLNIIHI